MTQQRLRNAANKMTNPINPDTENPSQDCLGRHYFLDGWHDLNGSRTTEMICIKYFFKREKLSLSFLSVLIKIITI